MALKSLTAAMVQKTATRFWAKVVREEGCWKWIASIDNCGYGIIGIGQKLFRAHRVSWVLHNGEIPADQHVLHTCDTRSCCNPAHLFLGTHADNMRDMAVKGRARPVAQYGEANPSAKLNRLQVTAIRERYIPGEISMRCLADEYGVSVQSICNVIHGKRWAQHGA